MLTSTSTSVGDLDHDILDEIVVVFSSPAARIISSSRRALSIIARVVFQIVPELIEYADPYRFAANIDSCSQLGAGAEEIKFELFVKHLSE